MTQIQTNHIIICFIPLYSVVDGTALDPLVGSCYTPLEAMNKYLNICLMLFCPASSKSAEGH